jgi:hypothetical protein
MAGYSIIVMGVEVEVQPRIVKRPERVIIEDAESGYARIDGYGAMRKWDNIRIQGINGQMMCEFVVAAQAKSMVKPPGPPILRVGFIQIILSTLRVAVYRDPQPPYAEIGRISRPSERVPVGGLLDCGTKGPPWLEGKNENLTRPIPGANRPAPPMSMRGGDNPRWIFPVSVPFPGAPEKTALLSSVTMQDRFRLFVVAHDGKSYHPVAQTEWGTDFCYRVFPGAGVGAGPAGKVPWGSMTRKELIGDEKWSPNCTGLTMEIINGRTANQLLIDRYTGRMA